MSAPPPADQLGFVLHLGDFIYEVVEYPDEVKTRYDRTIYEVARIPDGGKVGKFHFPLTVDGYRAIYKGYLADPDLQDARARWPFVAMWDNHEFSWQGWQSIQKAGKARPGQSIKVAANQAWWEYLPSRCKKVSGPSLESFDPPAVKDVAIEKWDENGLGDEPNNLAAINSLIGYRSFRYGKHLDLIITDQHSYRSADPFSDPALAKLGGDGVHRHGSPEDLDAGARRRPRVQRRQSAGRSQLRRRACPKPAEGRAAADDPRRNAKSVVQGSAAQVDRDVEDLGQFGRRARRAQRSAEPAPGLDQGNVAQGHLCMPWAPPITAWPTPSAPRSTTSSATRRSPASRSSRATATASGRATRRRNCRRASSSRSA